MKQKVMILSDFMWLKNFDAGLEIYEIITVCLTLVLVVIVAKFIGTILPIIAKKIGFDPAVMASPLVTTILDAISLVIYFSIASALLISV